MKNIFSVLAGVIWVIAFVPYVASIFKGKTKPMKASWLIWLTIDYITFAGMIAKHSLNGQMIGVVSGGTVVLVLALIYGDRGWSNLDRLCLGGAVFGVILWGIFRDPNFGIAVALTVGIIGSFPTYVSAWRDPSRENRAGWTLFFISCVFAIMAIPKITFQDVAQPIAFFVIEAIMIYILYIHARKRIKAGER